jgi:archaeosine-15-forming tRNA-guanine transglycosylase
MVRMPKWLVVVVALAFLAGLASPAFAEESKGKIKSVTADKNEFVFTDKDNKDWTFQMAKEAKVKLANKDVTLNDLKPGDEVIVVYEKQGDRLIATEVRGERK